MQGKMQKAIYVAALSINLLLPTWATADVTFRLLALGGLNPTPTQARATVAKLSTELAVLAGLNSSLADAMLSNGPPNVSWMYSSLEKINRRIRRSLE